MILDSNSFQSKYAKYIKKNPISYFIVCNFIKEVRLVLNEIKFDSILDVGCGEGILLSNLENYVKNKRCCAIDLDENDIKDAKKNLPFCQVEVGSVYKLPYNSNSFKLITCTEVNK